MRDGDKSLWHYMTTWEKINHVVGLVCAFIIGMQLGNSWIAEFIHNIHWGS